MDTNNTGNGIMFHYGGGPKNTSTPQPVEPGLSTMPPFFHVDHPGHNFVHIGEGVIQPAILGVGIATNILSLLILRRVHISDHFKICIKSLTVSDLLASLFGFVQILVEVIVFKGNIPFGYYHPEAIASHTLYYIFLMFMCTSSGLVILIVVIRSLMISKPMTSRDYLTPRRVKIFCVLVSVVTFLLFLPTSVNVLWEVCYHDFEQHEACVYLKSMMPGDKWFLKYLYALTIVYGPLLLIIYLVCFIQIKVNLGSANRSASEMMDGDINAKELQSRLRQTARVTKVLLAILLFDCICIIPTCLQGIGLILAPNAFIFDKTYIPANIFDVICEIFLVCRPTVNFIIYVCIHKEFRHQCGVLFGKGRHWAESSIGHFSSHFSTKRPQHRGSYIQGCELGSSISDPKQPSDSPNVTNMSNIDACVVPLEQEQASLKGTELVPLEEVEGSRGEANAHNAPVHEEDKEDIVETPLLNSDEKEKADDMETDRLNDSNSTDPYEITRL